LRLPNGRLRDRGAHSLHLPKRPRDPNQLAKSIIDNCDGEKLDRDPTPEERVRIGCGGIGQEGREG